MFHSRNPASSRGRRIVTTGLLLSALLAAACQLSTSDYPAPLTGVYKAGASTGDPTGSNGEGGSGSCASLYGGVCSSELSSCANPIMGSGLCTQEESTDAGSSDGARTPIVDAHVAAPDTSTTNMAVSADSGATSHEGDQDAGSSTTTMFCCRRGVVEGGSGPGDVLARD
jgi:hypothetical protein